MIETMRVALGGLSANKLRSGLTILGLMIGVGSVIVLIAVGTGSSAAVTNQIDALGSNVLLVSGAPTLGGLFSAAAAARARSASASTGLTVADANALVNPFEAPDVHSASPVVTANSVTLTYGETTYSPSSFVGTTPVLRGGAELHDGRGLVVHERRRAEPQPGARGRTDRGQRAVQRRRTRSARRSRSTAPTSRSSA